MVFIWSWLLILCIKIHRIQSLDQGCIARPRDIVVVLDSSDNVSDQEFSSSKIAVVNFLSYFPISPEATRVSLLGFGGNTKKEFNFIKHTSPPGMNFAVRLHKKIRGGSVLGEALNLTLNDIVPEMRGGLVDRILLLVSNGKNSGLPLSNVVAPKLKAKNVLIYTVGIGSDINNSELKEISSDNHVILFPDFETMQTDFKKLINVICTIDYVTNTPSKPKSTTKTETSTQSKVGSTTAKQIEPIVTETNSKSENLTSTSSRVPITTTKSVILTSTSSRVPITKSEILTSTSTRVPITNFITTTTTKRTIPTFPIETKKTTTSNFIEISTPDQDCNTEKIDLMFALDASSSLALYWQQELTFTNNVIKSLQIGEKYSQVGVLIYSDIIEVSVPFGSMLNKTELQRYISKIELLEGATFIANALNRCQEEFKKKGREGVKKTIILVTDGADNSPNLNPEVEAEKLKKMGIRMIVIGLGYSVIKHQLNKMSSSETYYPIEDMSKMALFDTTELAQDACHIEKPKRICNAQLDIALIIDSSSQIPTNEWIKQLLFAKRLIDQFELGVNNTRFSLISFSNEAFVEEEFTHIYPDLFKKLESLKHIGGFTRIDKALTLAGRSFYLKSKNARKLVVLLTNGLSMERVQSIGAAYDLQERGVDILTIGLGEKADREELRILSSLIFLRQDVKEEQTLLENAVKAACRSTPVVKPNVCSANGDIIFIVDKSMDNTNEIWEGIRSLMLTTLHSLNISRTTSRISIIDYSDEIKTEFRLDEAFTKRDIYVAIKQLRSEGNGGVLDSALSRARQIFKIDNRINVAKMVIVFTDKLPSNQKDALSEAENLKVDGVTILYVGLSKNSPYNFYEQLASKKSSIKVENINQIEKNKEQIKNLICDVFKNKQDECSMKKLDVIVGIDKSSSLGPDKFQIELDFINRIVGNLDLRKDRTRIGVFTFNTYVDLNIPLDSNFDNAEIQKEINKIPFIEGMTAIGSLIGNATEHFRNKGRQDIPKVLVVLTDGSNTEGIAPQIPAVEAKRAGIKIISVGVGDLISEKELKDISTSGELYNIKTFKDLEKFNAKTISNDACQIPQKPTICKAAGDLIYIMGSSADKGSERFNHMSSFMKSLTKLTVVDKENTRVAILKFNRGKYIDSGFQENYKHFEDSIDNMTTSTNGVFIGKALTSARVLFNSDTRTNATKTVIIIIDSEITDRNVTFKEAELLKKAGIKVFTIGLTGKTSDSDLKLVASPDKALFVDNFSNLQKYNAYISSELCDVIRGTNKECSSKQLDIMFALDSSSSLGETEWQYEVEFVERIVRDMDISEGFTRVGVVTFNTLAKKEFGLEQYYDKYALISAVKKIPFDEGTTDIGEALRECKWELMNSTRREAPKVIILVTDGVSTGSVSPEIESVIIKKQGIKIIVIGIGDSISPSQLKSLSSSGTFYRVLDFKTIKDYDTTFITRESCKIGKKS
uniref:Collagen alpha-6 like protein n=1 Tax=Dugesia japonica TaxID=6161 RepID=A0AAN0LKA6_DUGJA